MKKLAREEPEPRHSSSHMAYYFAQCVAIRTLTLTPEMEGWGEDNCQWGEGVPQHTTLRNGVASRRSVDAADHSMTSLEELVFKWSGKEFVIAVGQDETVSSLKRKIQERTSVQPKRQKLLGLKDKSGKLPTDGHTLAELQLKPGQKIMLMG